MEWEDVGWMAFILVGLVVYGMIEATARDLVGRFWAVVFRDDEEESVSDKLDDLDRRLEKAFDKIEARLRELEEGEE